MTDPCTFRDCDQEGARTFADHSVPGGQIKLCAHHAFRYIDATPYEGNPSDWAWKLQEPEKPSCPRCAELETRLANFERETFAELRARVAELEAGIHEIQLMSVPAGYDPGNSDITKVCKRVLREPFKTSGYVYLPESADPDANPTEGTFMWVDEDGKVWLRQKDGTKIPHPLLNSDDEEK